MNIHARPFALRLGAVIRDGRVAAGLTQTELAARVGVDQGTVSAWECGIAVPRLDVFGETVVELDLDVDIRLIAKPELVVAS